MKLVLSIVFFLLSLNLMGQSYQLVIDGRLPPGNQNGEINYGDGTFTARGGSVNFSINNFSQENVQFREILDNQTFSILNLRIEYFPVPCPNETFGKGETYDISELITGPNQNRMGISQCEAYISVDAIPENMSITTNNTIACAGQTIDLLNSDSYPLEARTWRYRIPAYQGNLELNGYIPDDFLSNDKKLASFTMQDLLEEKEEDAKNYIGSTVEFYMGYGAYRFSESILVLIDDCTPLAQAFPLNAACFDGTGSVDIQFERGLRESENEYILIELNNVSDGFNIPLPDDEINSLDNNNGYSIPESLIPGSYEIQFQSWVDPDNTGIYYPKGLGIPVSFEILAPSPVVIDNVVTVHNPSCPGEFGERTIEVSGGQEFQTGIYQYTKDAGASWQTSTSPNSITYTDLEPSGNYTFGAKLVFTDGIGECISDSSIYQSVPDISNPLMLAPGTGIVNQPSSPTSEDGIIFAEVTGGNQNFNFELYSPSDPVNPISTITQPARIYQFTNLGIGIYFLKIKDNNGCEVENESTPYELAATPSPTIDSQQITEIGCLGDNNGSIIIDISNGVAPYNYEWTINGVASPLQSTGGQTISLNNLSEPGEYILKVASTGFTEFDDPSGYDSTSITLNTPEEVIINSATPNNISCLEAQDGSISVTASGGSSYEYKLDFFGTWTPLNNGTIPINIGGFYDVYIRNQNNCESDPVLGILISEPDELIVSTTSQNATTNGGYQGSITLTIVGGTPLSEPTDPYAITWTKDSLPFTPPTGSTSTNLISLEAGEYIAQITDANGCSPLITPSIVINQPGSLGITSVSIQNEISCSTANDGIINANVTGTSPITFEWRLNGAPFRTLTDDNTLINIGPGDYQFFLNDGSLIDPLESEVITLTQPTNIFGTTNITPVSCFGGNDGYLQIDASGGTAPYTFSLDGTDYQNSNIYNNLPAGSYTIYVRDSNGCLFASDNVIVDQPQQLNLTINEQRPLTVANASDGAISVSASGGTGNLSYSWIGPDGFTSSDEDISNLLGGEYILTITDENYTINNGLGCRMVSIPITISEPVTLWVDLVQTVILECSGDDFAEITSNVQGGVPPYTYEWFHSINGNNTALNMDTEIIGNLPAGNYYVRVTDANDISADSLPISITQPDVLQITIIEVTGVLCYGDATGAIAVSVSGGTGLYSYLWSNGSKTPNLIDLEAGEYTLEVYDDNGCYEETTVTINPMPDPVRIADAIVSNISQFMANDGSISLQLEGGAIPYAINWIRLSDNMAIGNAQEITNLTVDSYEVSISDNNGCSLIAIYDIFQPDIVEGTITQPSCTGQDDGSIKVLVNQGNGTFTYSWDTGATTNNITNLSPGNYTITINGFGDGVLTRTYVIKDPMPFEVNLGKDRTLCAGQELVLDANMDNATATYLWGSNNGFFSSEPSVTINESGNYTVTVSNQNGCMAKGSIFVDVTDDEISAEFAVSSQVFVGESLIAVDISYPLPETQLWILPEGTTIIKQDSDEAELVFNEPGEYEIGIMTQIGECFAQQTKKVLVIENEVLTEGDRQEDPRKLIEDFIIYPNPTDGKFTADIVLSEQGNISIKIFNFANNALKATIKDRGASSYLIPLDISGLPSGIYAVLLETPYGNSLRKIILM